jgi:hypothetical protein
LQKKYRLKPFILLYPLFFNDRIKQQDVICHPKPHWTFHIAAIFVCRLPSHRDCQWPCHCLKGELAGPDVTIHLKNYRLFWRILIKTNLAIGEAYMDSSLTISNDYLENLMAFLIVNNGLWQNIGWQG